VVVFFPLKFQPSIHLSKDVVQFGLAIARRLGIDLEIVCLGSERYNLPSGIHCHDLTHGDEHYRKSLILLRLARFFLIRKNIAPVYLVFFWGFWAWISIPMYRAINRGLGINKLDGNPKRISSHPQGRITNLRYWFVRYWIERGMIALYSRHVDLVICESQALKRAMKSSYPSAGLDSKLQVIPSGVTTDFISECELLFPREKINGAILRVLFLGRVNEPFKGLEVFLRAIPFVSARDVEFIICGQRGQWSDTLLENFFHERPELQAQVVVIDNISGARKVAELLAEVDVLCFPSFDTLEAVESFGLVLVEAICAGVYFIASDSVPSAPDLLGKPFGEIFRSGDAEDLAEKIDGVAQEPARLEAVRTGGLAEAKRLYHWDALAEQTYAVLGKTQIAKSK
jgi:glycosyltransferase involved in cell wall biosynthesis